jgi:hypothetical protein
MSSVTVNSASLTVVDGDCDRHRGADGRHNSCDVHERDRLWALAGQFLRFSRDQGWNYVGSFMPYAWRLLGRPNLFARPINRSERSAPARATKAGNDVYAYRTQ